GLTQMAPHGSCRALLTVSDSRAAAAELAAAFFEHPAGKMLIVGVTGTDGKTTTANLIGDVFSAGGYKAGVLSTVALRIDGQTRPNDAHNTTPEALLVQSTLRDMVVAGVERAVVEATSHALVQE